MIKSLILLTFLFGMNFAHADPLQLHIGFGMSPSIDKVLPGVTIEEEHKQWYSDSPLFMLRLQKTLNNGVYPVTVEYTHISDPLKTELDFGVNLIAVSVRLY